jgi:hypothetical protein
MSTKGNLTREEAVAQVGEQAVAQVEAQNCDFTNRVMESGWVEFSASIKLGEETMTAYYYQTQAAIEAAEDLGSLTWEVEGYEVV